MASKQGITLKSLIRSAIGVLVDRILGPDDRYDHKPGDTCVVLYSVVAANNGVLLKGSRVQVTDVKDPKGRIQVCVTELPDQEWDETSRLPYGPGFVLYVDPDCLSDGVSDGRK
jgi:hypothetical protein